jgi:uncharacterized protein YuzE
MRLTYDPVVDAAYMSFTDKYVGKSSVEYTEEQHDYIIFDFDVYKTVIGIEFLQVSKMHPQLLKGIAHDIPRV